MFKQVNPKQNFPELEEKITKFWKENRIFEKSVENRDKKNRYVFYDGPPFITGTPHYGSLLPSIAKDVVPRYQTMRGKRVERVWGWDCHGLPIETKVEKKLEIKNRREIEKYGIQKFIDECYNYTRDTSAEWRWYIDKIGRWVDMDNAYRTMDQDYMESVMWVFKELYDKELIYEGVRTSLFCTRCGTPVSNFEIAMDNSYSDMEDPAITVKFPITSKGRFEGKNILAWTTTPWTLPSNKALVVDPRETYVEVKVQRLEVELEQAWIVKELPKDIKKAKRSEITQVYIDDYIDENGIKPRDARARKIDGKYEFTTKYYVNNKSESGQLIERTKEISKEEYIELAKQASKKIVKTRFYYPLENALKAEIDVYRNQHEGIIVVEVEFPSLSKLNAFKKPIWFGHEITDCEACWPYYMSDRSSEELIKELNSYKQAPHNYDADLQQDIVIVGKKRAEFVFENIDHEILEEFEGKELLGLNYTPPFDYFKTEKGEHKVYSHEGMVHMEEGTGIVHSAPGFGDIDTEMGQENKLTIAMSITDEGKYLPIVKDFEGMYVKEADPIIIENLKSRDLLFKSERILHRYPYCYRCETPLIHKAQPSWFINIEKLRKDLLKNNQEINWVPEHLKNGRFKKGIELAPDWGISRTRFWATPMPVWQNVENGVVKETVVIGSRDELREKSIEPITKLSLKIAEVSDGKLLTKDEEKKLSKLVNKLTKDTEDYFEIGESLLRENLSEQVEALNKSLLELLSKEEGNYLEIKLSNHTLALMKHIVEGKTLMESFSSTKGADLTLDYYFLGTEFMDLHRPKIDNVTIKGKTGTLTRIPEVLDVWMDSASMPYASEHYPFENKATLEENYPADFIVEYIAQTRAWFYVMHVISTALLNKPSFKNVVTTGVIFGTDGRKMSKSYGNYPDPRETLEQYGAEPLRLYFMGSKIMLGEDINFDEEALREQVKTFLLPLWNSYSFFVTYANMHNWEPSEDQTSDDALDKWVLVKFEETKAEFIKAMDAYNIPAAVRLLPEFIDSLSRWYIRRSRQRFSDGNKEALSTLHKVLIDFVKLASPIVPFITEEIYQNLSREKESVHLEDISDYDESKVAEMSTFLTNMELVRRIANLGQSLRVQNALKVRQPLSEVVIKIKNAKFIKKVDEEWMTEIIKDELNVKKVSFVNKLPKSEGWLRIKEALENNAIVEKELTIGPINLGTFAKSTDLEVALNSKITPELEAEGIIRELSRQVQSSRKKLGLNYEDTISLTLHSDDEKLNKILQSHEEELKQSTGATSIRKEVVEDGDEMNVNGMKLNYKIVVD